MRTINVTSPMSSVPFAPVDTGSWVGMGESAASPVDTKLMDDIVGIGTRHRRAALPPSPVRPLTPSVAVAVGGRGGNAGVTGCIELSLFRNCKSNLATPLSSRTPTTCAWHKWSQCCYSYHTMSMNSQSCMYVSLHLNAV